MRIPRAFEFVLFVACMLALGANAADEKKVALVIGNSKYAGAPLKNPVNDANAMAKKLQSLGFDVTMKLDIGQREMTRAITAFGQQLTAGSVGLFYYAGHGMQAKGRNYLIPVDADITSEASVASETVDVDRVLDQLSNARLSMVVLDACRNNPFERRFRSGTGSGLAQIDAPAGTLIAYATSPGKVALDGEGNNGTYTEALLKAMDTPGLRVEDVFKQVRIQVLKVTSNQQIPWESSSLTGDFRFRAPVEQPVVRNNEAEAAAAALREQMAALSAEIAKMRESRPAPSPVPSVNEEEQKKAQKEAAALREQLAMMTAEIAKLKEKEKPAAPAASAAQSTQGQKQADAAAAALNAQVASLNAELAKLRTQTGSREATPEERAAWKKQIAKVEAMRGKLTLASGLAALLDITDQNDLAKVRDFESTAARRSYSNAVAMGVDATGLIVWGGSYFQISRQSANEVAVDFCNRSSAAKCRPVATNGDFNERNWIDIVSELALQPLDAVRSAFLSTIAATLTESAAGMGPNPALRNSAMGYTYARARTH